MKLLVISDTHARHISELAPNLLRALSRTELIVHAGDFVTLEVIRGLETLAPVKGVCGNRDTSEVRQILPERDTLELSGRRIGIVHGSGGPWGLEDRVRLLFPGFDAVIFGHSHRALNRRIAGALLFNPGSAQDSYGLLEITEGEIRGSIIEL